MEKEVRRDGNLQGCIPNLNKVGVDKVAAQKIIKNGRLSCDYRELPLDRAEIGSRVFIVRVAKTGSEWHRLIDLGIYPGACVLCQGESPCLDPRAYMTRGAVVAIRNGDSRAITVKRCEDIFDDGKQRNNGSPDGQSQCGQE